MIEQAIPAYRRILLHIQAAQSHRSQVSDPIEDPQNPLHRNENQFQTHTQAGTRVASEGVYRENSSTLPNAPSSSSAPHYNPRHPATSSSPSSHPSSSSPSSSSALSVESSVYVSVQTLDLALATDEHLLAVLSVAGLSLDVSSTPPEVILHINRCAFLCWVMMGASVSEREWWRVCVCVDRMWQHAFLVSMC